MLLHPSYDPEKREWFVEYGTTIVVAPTLASLKSKFSIEVKFPGYYPNGYVAVRAGFLEPSGRKSVIVHQVKTRAGELPPVQAQPVPAQVLAPEPEKPAPLPPVPAPIVKPPLERVHYKKPRKVDVEAILNAPASKSRQQIAQQVHCSVRTVGFVRAEAKALGDKRVHRKTPWTKELDLRLKSLAETPLPNGMYRTAAQIAALLPGKNRNSIIGRAHRKGIQLGNAPRTKGSTHVRRLANEVDLERSGSVQPEGLDQREKGNPTTAG